LPTIFAQGLSTEGTYIIVFNVAIFVLGQPWLVAVWDNSPLNQVPKLNLKTE
jgi:hypothetical protein